MPELHEIIPFLDWTRDKIAVQCRKQPVYFKERQIWWASLGQNIGSEMNGKNRYFERPVLIFRKFGSTFWGMPLTSRIKTDQFHEKVEYGNRKYYVSVTQIRLMDSQRLLRLITLMDESVFLLVTRRTQALLAEKNNGPTLFRRSLGTSLKKSYD